MTILSGMMANRPKPMSLTSPRDSSFDLLNQSSVGTSDSYLQLSKISSAKASLNPALFRKYAALVYSQCGITLPDHKNVMLASRIQKRLRATGIQSFEAYYRLLVVQESAVEMTQFINAITTNKTDFFRESYHFELLQSTVLPKLWEQKRHDPTARLFAWSAGCATGEEPYSIAMTMADSLGSVNKLSILATDVDTRVLQTAQVALYSDDAISPVPGNLRYKFLMKGTGQYKGIWRVVPELRERIHFDKLNFMEKDFGFSERMDFIFCRNVTMYFDKPTKRELMEKFYRRLAPGGYLFLGHSETLNGISDKFIAVEPTVYQKPFV